MVEIIPAILEKDWEEVENKLNLVEGLTPYVQIDITDGNLTPEASWDNAEQLKFFMDNNRPSFSVEIDLMTTDQELQIQQWVGAGASRLIFHFEALSSPGVIFEILEGLEMEMPDAKKVEVGFALNVTTPIEDVYPWLDKINLVQLMGIDKIGFQGQPFDERVLDNIKALRKKSPNTIISIDGGVNFESAPKLIKAGANILISGSSIFKKGDILENIEKLQNN